MKLFRMQLVFSACIFKKGEQARTLDNFSLADLVVGLCNRMQSFALPTFQHFRKPLKNVTKGLSK